MRFQPMLFAVAATLLAAPALAQEAAQTPPAASGSISIQPGSNVRGSDGTVLGVLEGVRNNDTGAQELTVRGSDGELRGVPLAGLTQQGADVIVGWSSSDYQAAPAIPNSPPPAWNDPNAGAAPASDAAPTEGETPSADAPVSGEDAPDMQSTAPTPQG